MYNKLKPQINKYKNKTIIKNKNSLTNITYNKPQFINMKKRTNFNNDYNIGQKISSCSTKISSANSESANNGNNFNNNGVYNVKDFDIDKNYSRTHMNFFPKHINTSVSSNEEYNYESFTPSRKKDSPFTEEEQEQFTPYLGQKISTEKIAKNINESSNYSFNDCNYNKNSKYSNAFKNSKKIKKSTPLNLLNNFEEQLSNNYKIIDKYEKLSIYQKDKELSRNHRENNLPKKNLISVEKIKVNNKSSKKNILYKKKLDLASHREIERKILGWFYINGIDISEREIYEKYVILIQTIYRGYISRIKLYSNLQKYTCISMLNQILSKLFSKNKINIYNYCFEKILKYIDKKNQNYKMKKESFTIESKENNRNKILSEEIKELINQNNQLQIKLNEFLINNNILKNDISNYKEFELKYKKLLLQLEKLQNNNNNILKENNRLLMELNNFKKSKSAKNYLISPQNKFNINNNNINKYKKIEIFKNESIFINSKNKISENKNIECSNISNISILKENISSIKKIELDICTNVNNIEIKNNFIINKFKRLDICNNLNNISFIHGKENIINNNNNILLKIENIENFFIKTILPSKIDKTNLKIEKIVFLNFRKDEKENSSLNNNKQNIKSERKESFQYILAQEPNIYDDEITDKNNEELVKDRSSIRISLRNKKIESQEANLESEENNLPKEEIIKRKRLRNLFKNKLFMLRDITRKYFLRFYYNGIYIKMVGKKPKPIGSLTTSRVRFEDKAEKRSKTCIERGKLLRRKMSQKKKNNILTLKKHFNIMRQGNDFPLVRKKLIEYKKELIEKNKIKKNELLISFINKNDNGDFSYLNLKRWMIIWEYKIKRMKKKELNLDTSNEENDDDSKISKEDEKENEESEEDSIENFIKNNLSSSRSCVFIRKK